MVKSLRDNRTQVHEFVVSFVNTCTEGLPMYVIFTAKCFPHKLKYLHTSRFHGAFSLDEISLKPVLLRHLILGSKDNF